MRAIIFFIFSLGLGSLQAGFKIPKGVFTVSELEEARDKAIEENKPLVFVLTDSGST